MVAWIVQPNSDIEGTVPAYVRTKPTSNALAPVRAAFDAHGGLLASPGTVDANLTTRYQYVVPSQAIPSVMASANFRYASTDIVSGRAVTGTLFLAPASAFASGVVPTPGQIRAAAVTVIRGRDATGASPTGARTNAGDLQLTFFSPNDAGTFMEPNQKFWVMVAPTSISYADLKLPATATSDVPLGDVNVNGRAVSFWTNRTPKAPIIKAPVGNPTAFPGSTLDLAFVPQDPDRVTSFPGDIGQTDFDDVAGVHVQYAAQPTEDDPEPLWVDLPIVNSAGDGFGSGWYIDGIETGTGAKEFWKTYRLKIKCAAAPTETLVANMAHLGAGDWQVRVRTFDYGHPFPNAEDGPGPDEPPLMDTVGFYTMSNYPAENTSPWSEPVKFSIGVQVPKATPLSPINNIAIAQTDSNPVVLDRCDSAAGWTGTLDGVAKSPTTFWEPGAVGLAVLENPDGVETTMTVTRPGPVDLSGHKYLIVTARSGNTNVRVRANGTLLQLVSKSSDNQHGTYLYLTGGLGSVTLTFEYTRAANEAWAFLLIQQVTAANEMPIVLSWRYRNAYTPPYPQYRRWVRIRKVGDSAWTMLADAEWHSGASLMITDYAMVSGNQYEWQVSLADQSGVQSEYSDSAFFWLVPKPASGEIIPLPSETIEGATLGCGTHRIEVYRRGGKVRVGVLDSVSSLEWNRVRDDISTAKVVISGWGIDCGNLLASLQTWAYELVIYRDNGHEVDRVWEGPITLLTYENDAVTIQAKDVLGYMYRRIIKQPMIDGGKSPTAGRSVVARSEAIVQNAYAPDDPNVLAYLRPLHREDDSEQYRSVPAYSRTAFEEVDDMAANAGLDYTAVGRAILLWSTKHRIGTLPEFTDRDLGSSPIVSEYGMSMANRYVVSDGNGVYGEATRLNADGQDPTYGLVEMLSSTWASDSEAEEGTYTEAGLETVRKSFEKASERSIADRYPPPVVVRVPDNTRLNPDTVVSIRHLVPGVVVPLHSTSTLRRVKANQKLDAVKVVETAGDETITITLSPFSRDDAAMGEGEE